jgi:short-subunit dehydrogenase
MMSEVLRMEVAPFGIDVIEVQPGSVRSSIADNAAQGLERYASQSSRYQPVYAGIQRRAGASQENPMSAEDFAREVSTAILSDHPPRLVRKGRGANMFTALSKLPGELRDRILVRQFGLLGLREKARESRAR